MCLSDRHRFGKNFPSVYVLLRDEGTFKDKGKALPRLEAFAVVSRRPERVTPIVFNGGVLGVAKGVREDLSPTGVSLNKEKAEQGDNKWSLNEWSVSW